MSEGDQDPAAAIRTWDAVRKAALVLRVPAGEPVSGRLFVPTPGWVGMVELGFSMPPPALNADHTVGREVFNRAKAAHCRSLWRTPGTGSSPARTRWWCTSGFGACA